MPSLIRLWLGNNMESKEFLSITEFNSRIKDYLESSSLFKFVYLRGEISNYKVYPSGHAYFSLKDDKSLLSAMMWSNRRMGLAFEPKTGDEVIVCGSINVYPPRGSYSFIVDKMELYGQGNEALKLKLLYEKLAKEGLFDPSKKKGIPLFPNRIGVIAGANSAGLKDIIHNICLRYPLVQIYVFPSLVQGKEAPKDLLRALELASKANLDTLIIGRGGGSSEDLSAFNDESLIRALYKCEIPIISAVGHEIDTTLTDLVADKRVSTPTGAAVASTPNKDDLFIRLDQYLESITKIVSNKIDLYSSKLAGLSSRPYFKDPSALYSQKLDSLSKLGHRLDLAYKNRVEKVISKLSELQNRLNSLNPENVINRGYSLTLNKNNKPIQSIEDVEIGEELITKVKGGIIINTVKGKKKEQQ